MCLIVVALGVAPGYGLVVAANRDELHARPTRGAEWWEAERVFGGRDLEAGGTWLAIDGCGRFAAVTNIRDREPRRGPRCRRSGRCSSGRLRWRRPGECRTSGRTWVFLCLGAGPPLVSKRKCAVRGGVRSGRGDSRALRAGRIAALPR